MKRWFDMLVVAALTLALGIANATAATPTRSNFDHNKTGFPLEDEHLRVDCEACHDKGMFKGTPRQCTSCHGREEGMAATFRTADHIQTTELCEACHSTVGWTPVDKVDHREVKGKCSACHNGRDAPGKAPDHLQTNADCAVCHTITSWTAGVFDHTGIVGDCFSCHNGTQATGKTPTHIPSTNVCEECHRPGNWFDTKFDHTGITGNCTSCHNGTNATGKSAATHIPSSNNCEECHATATWFGVRVNHVGLTNCASCHDGARATGKSGTHIASSDICEDCHTYPLWNTARFDHAGVTSGCASCHNGRRATGKGPGHIATSAICEACHAPNTPSHWLRPTTTVDHAEVIGACSSCHDGTIATGRPATVSGGGPHPATGECVLCHTPGGGWVPASNVHDAGGGTLVSSGCFACHNGTDARGKSGTHITTDNLCESCHTPLGFRPVTPRPMNHAGVIGTCASCHNNVKAVGKSSTHITTSSPCDTCHTTAAWVPSSFSHAGITGACVLCHDGIAATGKVDAVPAHPSTSDNCNACHTSTAAGGFAFPPSTMAHTETTAACETCHDGAHSPADGKSAAPPPGHLPTSDNCTACHGSTTSWAASVTMDHGDPPVAAAACSTCHDGGHPGIPGKVSAVPAHPSTSDNCVACHTSTAPGGFVFPPSTMDHAETTAACETCHDGGHAPADGKSPAHFSTSNNCAACHTGYTAWTTGASMDHADPPVAAAACSTCHDGAHLPAAGKGTGHIPSANTCNDCHVTASWLGATVNHAGIVNGCNSCHDGTHTGATGKGPGHIASTTVCEACHTHPNWIPATAVDHAQITGSCVSCHTGTGSPAAIGKAQAPGGHLPTSDNCQLCHTAGTVWTPATMDHAETAAACSTCHDGSRAIGKLDAVPAHPSTSDNCVACHTSTAPGGFVFPPSTMDHAETTAACETCHDGGHAPADGKSPAHFSTSNNCAACHTGYTAWTTGANMDHTDPTVAAAACSTCHDGAHLPAVGQDPGHIVTAAPCNDCHTTDRWIPTTFNHTGITTGCSTCHNGTDATGKGAGHFGTSNTCESCHAPNTASHWLMPTTNMDHADPPVAAAACSTCHTGLHPPAMVKGSGHIPSADTCDDCHGTSNWTVATISHTGYTNNCSTCHDGAHTGATGKGLGHIASSNTCETCHAYNQWVPATAVDHAQVTGSCVSCHDGAHPPADGKSAAAGGHLPTSDNCNACHLATGATWAGATMDHAETTAACSTCHDGTHAGVKSKGDAPGGHPSTTNNCVACHTTTGTGDFAFPPSTMDHTETTAACVSCHDGGHAPADGKSPAHFSTSNNCAACHTGYTAWTTGANMDHTDPTVAAAACVSCHDGSHPPAVGTSARPGHIPIGGQDCSACHTTANWIPTTFAHTPPLAACVSCHNGTTATGKVDASPAHFNTTDTCEACHAPGGGWAPVTPRPMDHAEVIGACESCHDGAHSPADGKSAAPPPGHLPTSDNCTACHGSTSSWAASVTMDHAETTAACSTCHDGSRAIGKVSAVPAHPSTSDNCVACHTSTAAGGFAFPPSTMDHAQTSATCVSCHDGGHAPADGKSLAHMNTSNNCNACHGSTTSWTASVNMDHAETTAVCSACHDGLHLPAVGRPATVGGGGPHPATGECNVCHNTTSWLGAKPDHSTITSGCYSCHNNSPVPGKSGAHLPTDNVCEACHATTLWAPSGMDHSHTSATCVTCHDGSHPPAGGKGGRHNSGLTTSNNCDACHTTAVGGFLMPPTTVDHAEVTGTCVSCHTGTGSPATTGKGPGHFNTSNNCDVCHGSRTSWTASVNMDHAETTVTTCVTCHDGLHAPASGKAGLHNTGLTTGNNCEDCHVTTGWVPATMDHTGITSGCGTCHDGAGPGAATTGKSPTHFNTSNTCEACHGSTTSWAVAVTMDHGETTAACATCHDGSHPPAVGKSAAPAPGHIATTQPCDLCHNSNAWVPAVMDHTGITASCVSCHDGLHPPADGKSPTHYATTNVCEACHRSTLAWAPAQVMDHAQVPGAAGNCTSCHDGAHPPAVGKSPGHIPTTGQCDICHTTTSWLVVNFDHSGVTGNCSDCHNGTTATGKGPGHFVTSRECNYCHNTTAWIPDTFVHKSATFTGMKINTHSAWNSFVCTTCHTGNSESPAYINGGYNGFCAGCHASDFVTGPHSKNCVGERTLSNLKNCAGTCHKECAPTAITQHRVNRAGW